MTLARRRPVVNNSPGTDRTPHPLESDILMFHAPPRDDDRTPAGTPPGAVFGPYLGAGWLILGILWASAPALERIAERPSSTPGLAVGVFEALATVLAFAVTGHVMAIAGRLAAEAVAEWRERAGRSDEAMLALASRCVAVLDRLVEVLERRPVAGDPQAAPTPIGPDSWARSVRPSGPAAGLMPTACWTSSKRASPAIRPPGACGNDARPRAGRRSRGTSPNSTPRGR